MQSRRGRIDRFLSKQLQLPRKALRPLIAAGRVAVNDNICVDVSQAIDQFSKIVVDGETLQNKRAVYLMLHKPKGVVSATEDLQHTSVIDLIERSDRQDLHIAGRLDFNSSGLMLLTNNGNWSRQLSNPDSGIGKCYRVTLSEAISVDCVHAFAQGMYFSYEGIHTRPATLRILGEREAEVVLTEGRYHHIKRMFGRFNNTVTNLHRISIGGLHLDSTLTVGCSRELSAAELHRLHKPHLGTARPLNTHCDVP